MTDEAQIYRGLLIRAISGQRPAIVVAVADPDRLEQLCEVLARAERVAELLHVHGFGPRGMDIEQVVAQLLEKE